MVNKEIQVQFLNLKLEYSKKEVFWKFQILNCLLQVQEVNNLNRKLS